jgi:hypothetical protein
MSRDGSEEVGDREYLTFREVIPRWLLGVAFYAALVRWLL